MEQTNTHGIAAGAGLPGRYVAALFDLAEREGSLDKTAADFETLGAALAQSKDFAALLENGSLRRREQMRAIAAIAGTLQLRDLTARFLGVLAENGRLAILPAILAHFHEQLDHWRGIVRADVQSARELSAAQQQALRAQLGARTGRSVELATRIDPDLLGGLVVRIGSEQIDNSIKTRLERLGQALKG